MRQRVGMTDVAREAGVSVATVSNVLNQPHRVAEPTRSRVTAVIQRLGYVRSENARLLRGVPSRVLAVLVPDLANPFYAALVRGAEDEARKAGLAVLVGNSVHDPREENRYLDLFTEHQIRGVLLTPSGPDGAGIRALQRSTVPFVLVDQAAPSRDLCSVSVDDAVGGRLAMEHLIRMGHRPIAYVSGPGHLPQVRERRAGALQALSAAPQPIEFHELSCDHLTLATGRDAGSRLLGMRKRPTAVLCANDLLALGVFQTLHTAGLHVPQDMALAGYDDIELAAAAAVPLTSVRRPAVTMGSLAARLLIAETQRDGTPEHAHRQIVIEPELAVRQSTLQPPRRPPPGPP
ncbi:LacI family DNA-binding transcriptional regulator [Actinacidiphila glaucinigra]|uniref:LacI family DNA-binding transcriptional regulator n=2 Tax=Actinacidiphila glaucinigra TaxID=235986 RepID=UPI0035DEA8E6